MQPEIAKQPVATVTGLYRGKFGGLDPLTINTPLTRDEVRRNPIFYELDLHPELSDENLIARLVAIRGVGRWTVEMMLISTLGRMDVLPVDDYGVRMGYKIAANLDEAPKPKQLAEIGQTWSPYRSIAAWYFWRAVDLAKVSGRD